MTENPTPVPGESVGLPEHDRPVTRPSTPPQLPLADVPRRLFTCTPSRLLTWVDCPRSYRMSYLDRPRPKPGPPWAHNSLGAAVHNALAGWWRLPRVRRTPQAAGELLDAIWSADGFRDTEQAGAWRARARVLVERYVARLDPDDEPPGVERTLAMRTQRLAFSGRVDRLDERHGELVVVDYKTGRHALSSADVRGSLALALYALAAARTLRRGCEQVELHHLPTGEIHAWRHTPESLARALERSEQIADEIVAATDLAQGAGTSPHGGDAFPPRPGSHCGWCSWHAHCAAGQAAAPAREPWDGLGEL